MQKPDLNLIISQRLDKPGGVVTKRKRRVDEAGEQMVVRQNRMQAWRQAGCFQERIIPQQRRWDILYPDWRVAASVGSRFAGILL